MSDHISRELRRLDHIEDLLQAYADVRLSPAGPVLARMRAHVLAQAAANAAAAAAELRARESGVLHPSHWRLRQLQLSRRALALGLAATLTLGTGAAVLAAPPGSHFYNARVALEAALLPTQLDARLASHEQHLAQRLAEAEAAAASGNSAALEAALGAYAAEVDATVNELGNDPDLLAHLEEVLGKHVAVLTALQAKVPEQSAIDKAIESSQKAVEKIKEKGRNGGGRSSEVPAGPNEPGRP